MGFMHQRLSEGNGKATHPRSPAKTGKNGPKTPIDGLCVEVGEVRQGSLPSQTPPERPFDGELERGVPSWNYHVATLRGPHLFSEPVGSFQRVTNPEEAIERLADLHTTATSALRDALERYFATGIPPD